MFAEQLVVELPDFAAVPGWVYAAVAAAVWYPIAGVVLRRLDKTDDLERAWIWLLSPALAGAIVGVCVVACVVVGTVGVLSVVFWPLSGGLVRPFWRWLR